MRWLMFPLVGVGLWFVVVVLMGLIAAGVAWLGLPVSPSFMRTLAFVTMFAAAIWAWRAVINRSGLAWGCMASVFTVSFYLSAFGLHFMAAYIANVRFGFFWGIVAFSAPVFASLWRSSIRPWTASGGMRCCAARGP